MARANDDYTAPGLRGYLFEAVAIAFILVSAGVASCLIAAHLENKIAASRRFFNNAVQEYNTGIQQMPAALFAGMFGFTRKEFFDLGASRTEVEVVPTVKF